MRGILQRLWREEEGQDLIEYGMLLALLATAGIAAINSLAADVSTVFSNVGTNLTNASS